MDKGSHSITFPLDSVEAEIVSIMIGMGFFTVTGKRVQIVVPPTINVQTVKDGILQVMRTHDDVGLLHVDQLS